MIAILKFLIRSCPQLFEKHGFRFKDSKVGPNPGTGSWILLESDDVQIYISNEQELITWEMRSIRDPRKRNWYSFDLVAMLLGHQVDTGVMDLANSEFLLSNVDEIILQFKKENWGATIKKLNVLKAERSKHI